MDAWQPPKLVQEDLEEDADDFMVLCSRFRIDNEELARNLMADLKAWLRESERDFFYAQLGRDMLLCVRYDDPADGVDAWRLRVVDRVELPGPAVALVVPALGPPDTN